jgi:hypothetical protein
MVTNSTRVKYSFNVTKTTSSKIPKQSLVTFMMTESDYEKWAEKCIVCQPPTQYALKGTYCEGTSCSVTRKYLGQVRWRFLQKLVQLLVGWLVVGGCQLGW